MSTLPPPVPPSPEKVKARELSTAMDMEFEKLRLEQNMPLAIGAGAIAAIVGAIIWAAVTVATMYQIGYMAIGIGFLVGLAVRAAGKGIDKQYGVIGAAFALLGCVIGNALTIIGLLANDFDVSYTVALQSVNVPALLELMVDNVQPMDFLFYILAIGAGYRYSFRQFGQS